ncbi:MAG: hypothetical protein OEY67_10540, partial [Gammaproteobacteria bacterium]|nr:hypothetical protein [Gammaproteobacteria bacterium]
RPVQWSLSHIPVLRDTWTSCPMDPAAQTGVCHRYRDFPDCNGRLKILAAIGSPDAAEKILTCLGLPANSQPLRLPCAWTYSRSAEFTSFPSPESGPEFAACPVSFRI